MNSSNETYYELEYWFEAFGYPHNIEILTIYIVTPIGLISFALNLLTFMVLLKQCFLGSVFFSYMKLYIFNGAILSLICSTLFITTAQRAFSFTNTYEALAYTVYFFTSVQPMLILFSSFLEICVVIERSMYFLPKRLRKSYNIDFNKLTLFLFLFCIILHAPTFFLFIPAFVDVQLDENTPFRIWYIGIADFSNTITGKVLTYLQYVIRDVLPLITKLILNSLLVYLVKSYVNKLKKENITQSNIKSESFISKRDRNQTYISLFMSIFSILEHIFYIASYILYFLNKFSDSNIFFCTATFFISVKQMLNIFVFYKFNSLFKAELKKILNL